ncbi:MAG: pro-sigmaK processing inhibitor BofA family protein [Clostridium sp.]
MDLQLLLYGLIGVVILYIIIKLLKLPIKLLINGIMGVILLFIVNLFGANFGITIGINIVTSLIAGIFGIPGVAVLLVIQMFL